MQCISETSLIQIRTLITPRQQDASVKEKSCLKNTSIHSHTYVSRIIIIMMIIDSVSKLQAASHNISI